MKLKNLLQVFIVGMAMFSMFFGGGNLTFPIWIGSETDSVPMSSFGFILSGVFLPFYGIIISLYFKGDNEQVLGGLGKTIGSILLFSLLLFWIPLGSGPRCNQLAYGAFLTQTGLDQIPLWAYSAIYSVIVYILTYKKSQVIEILGKVITPLLIVALFILTYSIFSSPDLGSLNFHQSEQGNWRDLFNAFFAGYHTMDFIAAIFFSSTVIALIKEKEKDKFNLKLVRNASLFAISLLSIIYIALISIGFANADILEAIPRDRLLAVIGKIFFHDNFHFLIFAIITLSVLSTSMALSLVFSDYLRKNLFKNKLDHKYCLFISVFISYLLSIIGFDMLAVLISYAMAVLYPTLLIATSVALAKDLFFTPALALPESIAKPLINQPE